MYVCMYVCMYAYVNVDVVIYISVPGYVYVCRETERHYASWALTLVVLDSVTVLFMLCCMFLIFRLAVCICRKSYLFGGCRVQNI